MSLAIQKILIMKKSIRYIITSSIIVFAALGITYLIFSWFFLGHFFFNAKINNINVASCNVKEAKRAIDKNEYSLLIKTKKNTYTIEASDIDFKYNISENDIQNVLSNQNVWSWIVDKNHNYTIPVKVSYNQDKLKNILISLNLNKSRKPPVDAYITKENSDFVIKEEVLSEYFDENKLLKQTELSLKNMDTVLDIENKNCYKTPNKTHKSLYADLCQIRTMAQKNISFNCVYDKITIPKDTICSFLNYKNNKIAFNISEIEKYVDKIAEKYDTLYSTRTFTTSNNKKVEISPGNYGWLIDKEGTVEEIKKAFLSDENSYTFDAKYESTGFKTEKTSNDIGSTYIEISISKQHMWLYDNGKLLVETDVVTGNKDGLHDTPKGAWFVWSKQSPAILEGDDYRTSVNYWMAIDYTGVGIHDSTWRGSSEYGGNTYTYDGSHGCINTPYDAVEKIYNNIEAGIPVIVY